MWKRLLIISIIELQKIGKRLPIKGEVIWKNYYVQSMMCANFASLQKEIEDLEEGGIDIFHLDVMDGASFLTWNGITRYRIHL